MVIHSNSCIVRVLTVRLGGVSHTPSIFHVCPNRHLDVHVVIRGIPSSSLGISFHRHRILWTDVSTSKTVASLPSSLVPTPDIVVIDSVNSYVAKPTVESSHATEYLSYTEEYRAKLVFTDSSDSYVSKPPVAGNYVTEYECPLSCNDFVVRPGYFHFKGA